MSVFWYNKQLKHKKLFKCLEFNKLILKSLLNSDLDTGVFYWKQFQKFKKHSSISFYRRFCLFTGHSRSVSSIFKLTRQQCKNMASKGLFIGLRKSSF